MASDMEPLKQATPRISAIVPIFGKAGDLPRLLEHLRRQTLPPHEILVVDSSPRPLENPPPGVKFIKNPRNVGLGHDLNLGAQHATGDFLLMVQQDCLPSSEDTLRELYEALMAKPERVGVACTVTLPPEVWERYNFWGKVLMARWVGDVAQGVSDKFDLFKRNAFFQVGGYDAQRFMQGGQDMDLCLRLNRTGEVFVSPTRVLHLHNQSRATSWKELLTKQYQSAESFGALLRKWGLGLRRAPYAGRWTHHLAKYMYPLLVLLPFWPLPTAVALLVLSNLIHPEAFRVKSPKIALLIVLNPIIWLAGFAGTVRGLLTGRQNYSQDNPAALIGLNR
jgi:GT2 family glycosyltransferase